MNAMPYLQTARRSTQLIERTENHSALTVVANLDAWLDTMRGPEGYAGPVAHWWQNCLLYTGAGLDWRYEGIIIGYLELYRRTADEQWLVKACRAGDDLVNGQLSNGTYRNSSFELNPYNGGTPHEAACDLTLLALAQELRAADDPQWRYYLATAERNLRQYWIAHLWDREARSFRDGIDIPSFVPNKAATLSEALLALADLTGASDVLTYALLTLDAVLDHQVRGGALDGAIYQNSFGPRKVAKFFPYYVARCVPGLIAGYECSKQERYLDGAHRAMSWVMRQQYADGSFPQVVYPGGKVNRYPQWIAAVGDVLRAADLLHSYGFSYNTEPTMAWMLRGQQPSGGFATAHGFASQTTQHTPSTTPDFRDLLPVCGWSDKAFRYLTSQVPQGSTLPAARLAPHTVPCQTRAQRGIWSESDEAMSVAINNVTAYHWHKGTQWATNVALEALWK